MKRYGKGFCLVAVCILILSLAVGACAETAAELKPAKISATANNASVPHMTDNVYKTSWYAKKGYVQVDMKQGETAYGLYLCHFRQAVKHVIQIPDGKGGYMDYIHHDEEYLHQYTPLPGVNSFRIAIEQYDGKNMLNLTELRVLGAGELPDWVQVWETVDKADLLLLSAHPDDELLWFGGTLPTYAGERGKKVQLVYLAHGDARRKNELLDGLWTCGIRYYPVIGENKDFMAYNRATIYDAWGGTRRVYPWYVSILRRVKPEVVLTQDFNGEYGHAAHQITAYMTVKCIEYAADPTYDAKSFDAYGAWQVKKMYAHLYPENQIVMDWHQPLSAFGGKTGLEVAKDALWCHVSQRALTYQMLEEGPYDCRLFGLYFTAVGPDVAKNDFFENIP
ncbi:MAG: PIG-L family deacetylase [Clostridia bacterium]|nr:PIG-L family deacetylase [Clostridia bacterium]